MNIHSFENAEEFLLKGRNKLDRPCANNTRIQRIDTDRIALRLHSTNVVIWHRNGDVELNSGGWLTVTTKERINRVLPSPWFLYSDRGTWFLSNHSYSFDNPVAAFRDHCRITKDGQVVGADPISVVKARRKMLRMINNYSNTYVQRMLDGKISPPGPGDCFYCQCGWDAKKDAADCAELRAKNDHLISHMTEKYYVPSLIMRAAEERHLGMYYQGIINSCWICHHPEHPQYEFAKDLVTRETKKIERGGKSYFARMLVRTMATYLRTHLGYVA